jgi:hypothetical protein
MDINDSGNNNKPDVDFLKYCLPFLRTFPYNKLLRKDLIKIQSQVLKQIGVSNIFELKDKFEGEAFLKKTTTTYSTHLFLNRFLGFDRDVFELDVQKDGNKFETLNGKFYQIINFNFGQRCLFEYNNNDTTRDGVIFVLHRAEMTYLCGYMKEREIQLLYEDAPYYTTSTRNGYKVFIHFDKLKSLKELM